MAARTQSTAPVLTGSIGISKEPIPEAPKALADGTMVPARVLQTAKETITHAWEDWAGKGGVLELQTQLETKLTGISTYLFNLAKACAKAAKKDMTLAKAMFTSAVADAEAGLVGRIHQSKVKEDIQRVQEFIEGTEMDGVKKPSSWKSLKNNIVGAMKDGFNPEDYKSESALRAARRAGKAGNTGQNVQNGANGASTPAARAAKFMDTAEIVAKDSGEVQGAITEMLKAVHAINVDEHEDEVMHILDKAIKALKALMPAEGKTLVNQPQDEARAS